jgi:hypothetical protein
MRTSLIILGLCVGCNNAPASTEATGASSHTEPTPGAKADPDETADPTTPTSPGVETTTGFIEAKVDGELKRFEHLPAAGNMVAANGTFLRAVASAESKEEFKFTLTHLDVREMEFPTVIQNAPLSMRLAGMNYRDAEGTGHTVAFNDESLECQSLEELLLKCTFSGTSHVKGGGTVEITEGRLEVQLNSNAATDSFIKATSGAAKRPRGD